MKALLGTFNKEKALIEAYPTVKLRKCPFSVDLSSGQCSAWQLATSRKWRGEYHCMQRSGHWPREKAICMRITKLNQ